MKRLTALAPLALGLALAAGCGEAKEKGAGIVEAASQTASDAYSELSKLTPEAAQEKVTSIVNDAVSKLSSIKDSATAEKVKNELSPLLDQLGALKTALAGKLDLSALEKAAKDVMAKFSGDSGVKGALQPVLDEIQGLMK